MIEVGSLHYGVVFKKGFADPEIFTAFVKDILDIDIKIDTVEIEKPFTPISEDADSKFDLFAEDKENRIIVDIQHVRFKNDYHRLLHLHCMALMENTKSVADFSSSLQIYTIFVLTAGDQHERDVTIIDLDPKTLDGTPLGEIQHKMVYLCPQYLNETTPEPYKEWMQAIEDSQDGKVDESSYSNPKIQQLFQNIKEDHFSPEDRAKMMDEDSDRIDEDDLE